MPQMIFVCRDVCGTNALLLIAKMLREKYGKDIEWIVEEDGRAKDVLRNSGEKFQIYSGINQKELALSEWSALISSTCSTIALSLRASISCPIFVVQDQWGASLAQWNDSRPDFIFVNDEIDRSFTLNIWNGYDPNRVIITGYPITDRYAAFDVEKSRNKVKSTLEGFNLPMVLLTGQWWESGHLACETVRALNEINKDVCLIARSHPAIKDRSPEEIPIWEKALRDFKCGNLIDNSSSLQISDLIASSTVVISMFSTTLFEAAILRIPNIAVLYPDHGLALYRRVTGFDKYPMTELGCSALAYDFNSLKLALERGMDGSLDLELNQKKHLTIDGKNTERVAEFIVSNI